MLTGHLVIAVGQWALTDFFFATVYICCKFFSSQMKGSCLPMIKLLECEEYHPNSGEFGAHVKPSFSVALTMLY